MTHRTFTDDRADRLSNPTNWLLIWYLIDMYTYIEFRKCIHAVAEMGNWSLIRWELVSYLVEKGLTFGCLIVDNIPHTQRDWKYVGVDCHMIENPEGRKSEV